MPSSGTLRCVALVRTDVSEELSASFIRVTRIGEPGTTLDVTRNRIPEDAILHSHRRTPSLTIEKLLIRKRHHVLFLMPAFIVRVLE
jgi:hypothetical protein